MEVKVKIIFIFIFIFQSLKRVSLFLSLPENLKMKTTPVLWEYLHQDHASMPNNYSIKLPLYPLKQKIIYIYIYIYLMCECGENSTVFVWVFDDENLASLVLALKFWIQLPLQAWSLTAGCLALLAIHGCLSDTERERERERERLCYACLWSCGEEDVLD
jgi:hypothetical protein